MSYDSWMNARRVAVMGAGTMGSGIAAHLANLGFEVLLYDLSRESAQAGLDQAQKARPPHFYGIESVSRTKIASISEDLLQLRDVDWVCEAIIENAAAKRELYEHIDPIIGDDTMITTNTSGLEIGMLAQGRSDSFRKRFIGTHFFNPPRYLKLLELVPTDETDEEAVRIMTRFLEDRVGKRVIRAKDTPGFIANRYGMWCLFQAIHTAERLGFDSQTVDVITGPFFGRPKTATFRLADLIGLDVMEDVASNLRERCPDDPRIGVLQLPRIVASLMDQGWIGNKAGQGFYRRESSQFLALNFNSMGYDPLYEPDLPRLKELSKMPLVERLRECLGATGEIGEFVREHLVPSLHYALELGPEISCSVSDFDAVMKWGWGWEKGPFELIDLIGYENLSSRWQTTPLQEQAPFYMDDESLDFGAMSHVRTIDDERYITVEHLPLASSGDKYSIREDGAGGFIFEFRSKMNALDPGIVEAMRNHIEAKPGTRLTLANDGRAFSAGFDLSLLLATAEDGRFDEIGEWLIALQQCGKALELADSCAAVQGFALGGGLEMAMRCRKVVANPEATLGLPEAGVGLVPAGGGTALMRLRTQGDARAMTAAAAMLGAGRKLPATDGFRAHFLRPSDALAVNPDQLVFGAINAERPEAEPQEWQPAPPPLAGMIDDEIEKMRSSGEIGEYGAVLAHEIKHIFVKAQTEEEALEMEAEMFLRALGRPRTILRIKHMLETGKPLNN